MTVDDSENNLPEKIARKASDNENSGHNTSIVNGETGCKSPV